MITDELDAVAESIIHVVVFALEGERFNEEVKTDVWLVPTNLVSVEEQCEGRADLRLRDGRQSSKALARDDHVQKVRAEIRRGLEQSEKLDVVPARQRSTHLKCVRYASHLFLCCG